MEDINAATREPTLRFSTGTRNHEQLFYITNKVPRTLATPEILNGSTKGNQAFLSLLFENDNKLTWKEAIEIQSNRKPKIHLKLFGFTTPLHFQRIRNTVTGLRYTGKSVSHNFCAIAIQFSYCMIPACLWKSAYSHYIHRQVLASWLLKWQTPIQNLWDELELCLWSRANHLTSTVDLTSSLMAIKSPQRCSDSYSLPRKVEAVTTANADTLLLIPVILEETRDEQVWNSAIGSNKFFRNST